MATVKSELTFGAWLRSERSNHRPRISQERLAELTGIDRAYLSRIENDRVGLPLFETRQRIHRALGTDDRTLAEAGVRLREDFGYAVSLDANSADALPVRQLDEERAAFDRDNRPLTAAEKDVLKDAMFDGFDELEPADLREVIAIIQRKRRRER